MNEFLRLPGIVDYEKQLVEISNPPQLNDGEIEYPAPTQNSAVNAEVYMDRF
jgi:hypothetical protein